MPRRAAGGSAARTWSRPRTTTWPPAGRDEQIAAAFHEGVAQAAAACVRRGGSEPRTVVLSGGSFQNLRLLESTRERLANLGFRVLTHRLVPPNDGGISYGQAAVAARRRAVCA